MFQLPIGTIVFVTFLSVFFAAAAAVIPARKAAKSDILAAIATT